MLYDSNVAPYTQSLEGLSVSLTNMVGGDGGREEHRQPFEIDVDAVVGLFECITNHYNGPDPACSIDVSSTTRAHTPCGNLVSFK